MKTFKALSREIQEAKAKPVFSKKVDGVEVQVVQNGSKFDAIIDGDKLDSYSTPKEAEKMALQFLKQYKG